MSDYIYSVVNDFGNAIHLSCLTLEINASSIAQTLDSITVVDDVVTITFLTALTTGEETTLDNLVATHNPNCEDSEVDEDANSNASGIVMLGSDGTSNTGRYLDFHHNIPTSRSPMKMAIDLVLDSITLSLNSNETGSIEIYKDGSLATTVTLSNESEKRLNNLGILFERDSKLSAKISSGSFKDPILTLWLNKD